MDYEAPQINILDFQSLSFFPITPLVLWVIFFLAVIIFVILVVIFRYHWKKFTLDGDVSLKAKALYYGGSAILLFVMMLSAIIYQLSFSPAV